MSASMAAPGRCVKGRTGVQRHQPGRAAPVVSRWEGNSKARRRWKRRGIPNAQQVNATCKLCGGGIGPDITNRTMCYGCGPQEMRP